MLPQVWFEKIPLGKKRKKTAQGDEPDAGAKKGKKRNELHCPLEFIVHLLQFILILWNYATYTRISAKTWQI